MSRATKERPQLRIVADYISLDGNLVQIDPINTKLPDLCKVAMAEMISGQSHEIVIPKVVGSP